MKVWYEYFSHCYSLGIFTYVCDGRQFKIMKMCDDSQIHQLKLSQVIQLSISLKRRTKTGKTFLETGKYVLSTSVFEVKYHPIPSRFLDPTLS